MPVVQCYPLWSIRLVHSIVPDFKLVIHSSRVCVSGMAVLSTERNSLLPIFRLPPEILANIFIHGAREFYKNDDPSSFRIPDWVQVSYVCRHWRNVALECPTLWTYHFTVSLRWTEELLVRSKQAALKIRVQYRPNVPGKNEFWWSNLVRKLLNNTERIQELILHVPATVFPQTLSLYAPRLRSLDIHGASGIHVTWPTITDAKTPLLRELKLDSCPLSLDLFNLSAVTTLRLSNVPPSSQLNVMEFLVILSHIQNLENLRLENALPGARSLLSSDALGVPSKLDLPFLGALFLAAPVSTVIAFLSCVNISFHAKLWFDIGTEEDSSLGDYTRFSSLLGQVIGRFTSTKDLSRCGTATCSLDIGVYSSQLEFIFALSERNSDTPKKHDVPFVLLVEMDQSMTRSRRECVMSDVCSSISLIPIRELRVANPPFSPDFWSKTLGYLRELRCLKLKNGLMPDLASVLTPDHAGPVENPREHTNGCDDLTPCHMLVPHLEELKLYRIQFLSESRPSRRAIPRELLLDALSRRKVLCPRLALIERDDNGNGHWLV